MQINGTVFSIVWAVLVMIVAIIAILSDNKPKH